MVFKRFSIIAKEDYVIIEEIKFPLGFEEKFFVGEPTENEVYPSMKLKNVSGYLPDFIAGSSVLVASEKVKKFIENSSEKDFIDFQKIEIRSRLIKEKFYTMNILQPLSCIDRKRSVYDVPESNPNVIVNVRKLVIDIELTKNRKIFRLKEYPIQIFIDEDYAQQMYDHYIKDFRLIPLIGQNQ